MSSPAIVVGNRTGGQGKTVIAQLIHLGYSLGGRPIKAVSADSEEGSKTSKLGLILGNVEELGTGASLSDVRSNQHSAIQYWDRLGSHLMDGNCVIDLGANILPLVFQWAKERQAGRVLTNKEIVLVVPITAQKQSISDGIAMLKSSLDDRLALPFSDRIVVLNEYHGSFDSFQSDLEFLEIAKFCKSKKVKIVRLSKANVEIWDQVEGTSTSFQKLLNMVPIEFEKAFGLNAFAASGVESSTKEWIESSLASFREGGFVPPKLQVEDGISSPEHESSLAAAS